MWAVTSVWRTVESEPLILSHGASDEIGLEGHVEAGGGVVRKGKGRVAGEAARGSETVDIRHVCHDHCQT